MQPTIFPKLRDKRFGYINLAETAVPYLHDEGANPFLDPDYLDAFMADLRHQMNIDYTWGGYLEDRSKLWRGSYLDPNLATHVGIDIDVPASTALSVKHPGRVAMTVCDPDQRGGWGGVVIVKLDKPVNDAAYVLYAHLAHDMLVKKDDVVKPGDIIAHLGTANENGGWFEHLHVQALTENAWEILDGDLKNIDGYAAKPGGATHPMFPDPKIFL